MNNNIRGITSRYALLEINKNNSKLAILNNSKLAILKNENGLRVFLKNAIYHLDEYPEDAEHIAKYLMGKRKILPNAFSHNINTDISKNCKNVLYDLIRTNRYGFFGITEAHNKTKDKLNELYRKLFQGWEQSPSNHEECLNLLNHNSSFDTEIQGWEQSPSNDKQCLNLLNQIAKLKSPIDIEENVENVFLKLQILLKSTNKVSDKSIICLLYFIMEASYDLVNFTPFGTIRNRILGLAKEAEESLVNLLKNIGTNDQNANSIMITGLTNIFLGVNTHGKFNGALEGRRRFSWQQNKLSKGDLFLIIADLLPNQEIENIYKNLRGDDLRLYRAIIMYVDNSDRISQINLPENQHFDAININQNIPRNNQQDNNNNRAIIGRGNLDAATEVHKYSKSVPEIKKYINKYINEHNKSELPANPINDLFKNLNVLYKKDKELFVINALKSDDIVGDLQTAYKFLCDDTQNWSTGYKDREHRIKEFFRSLISDCADAYSETNHISCLGGIKERIYTTLSHAHPEIAAICRMDIVGLELKMKINHTASQLFDGLPLELGYKLKDNEIREKWAQKMYDSLPEDCLDIGEFIKEIEDNKNLIKISKPLFPIITKDRTTTINAYILELLRENRDEPIDDVELLKCIDANVNICADVYSALEKAFDISEQPSKALNTLITNCVATKRTTLESTVNFKKNLLEDFKNGSESYTAYLNKIVEFFYSVAPTENSTKSSIITFSSEIIEAWYSSRTGEISINKYLNSKELKQKFSQLKSEQLQKSSEKAVELVRHKVELFSKISELRRRDQRNQYNTEYNTELNAIFANFSNNIMIATADCRYYGDKQINDLEQYLNRDS